MRFDALCLVGIFTVAAVLVFGVREPADSIEVHRPIRRSRPRRRTKEFQVFDINSRNHVTEPQSEGGINRLYAALHRISDTYDDLFRGPCAVVASNVSLNEDKNAYTVRLLEMLELRKFHIHLILKQEGPDLTSARLREVAAFRGVILGAKDISITLVSHLRLEAITKLCKKIALLVNIDSLPNPVFRNIARHGIFIPLVSTIPSRDDTLSADSKRIWLSYDQIWLPSWKHQVDYNSYIMPFIEYATQQDKQLLWPVINGVVVTAGAADNKAFVTRSHSMLKRGELESRLRINFHRIRDISTPLPHRSKTPAKYAASIYEGRIHYALEGICHNVMSALMPKGDWELHIFHSEGNENFVLSLFGNLEGVILHKVKNSELSINQYNTLLTGADFWEVFKQHERVLIFQVDSFFLQPLSLTHLEYDYIGAPWCLNYNRPSRREFELGTIKAVNMISVGNGGFSMRNPAAMLRCIREYIPKLKLTNDYPEDLLFVQCLTALNLKIAPPSVAADFALEQVCNKADRAKADKLNTTAVHAIWYSIREWEFDKLIRRYQNIS